MNFGNYRIYIYNLLFKIQSNYYPKIKISRDGLEGKREKHSLICVNGVLIVLNYYLLTN